MTEPNALTAYAQNTAHTAQGLAQFAHQFQNKTKLAGLLTSYLTQIQLLENEIWKVVISCGVSAAVAGGYSHALDQLGELVGISRQGLSDSSFAFSIIGATLANNSPATSNYLYDLVLNSTGLMGHITEGYPAAVRVDPGGVLPYFPSTVLMALLRRAKPGGVALNLFEYPSGTWFTCSSSEFLESSATMGFDDLGPTSGGKLIGVLE